MSGQSPPETVSMRAEVSRGVSTLHVTGEIDMTSGPAVRDTLLACLDTASSAVVLDLSEVTFLASIGLALMIEARQDADRRGIAFVVVAAHRAVLRPIRATTMDRVLTVHPDASQAVAALEAISAATRPPSQT